MKEWSRGSYISRQVIKLVRVELVGPVYILYHGNLVRSYSAEGSVVPQLLDSHHDHNHQAEKADELGATGLELVSPVVVQVDWYHS